MAVALGLGLIAVGYVMLQPTLKNVAEYQLARHKIGFGVSPSLAATKLTTSDPTEEWTPDAPAADASVNEGAVRKVQMEANDTTQADGVEV